MVDSLNQNPAGGINKELVTALAEETVKAAQLLEEAFASDALLLSTPFAKRLEAMEEQLKKADGPTAVAKLEAMYPVIAAALVDLETMAKDELGLSR